MVSSRGSRNVSPGFPVDDGPATDAKRLGECALCRSTADDANGACKFSRFGHGAEDRTKSSGRLQEEDLTMQARHGGPYDHRMPWTYQEQLRDARTRAGLTQDEAAAMVGVKERTWGSWERGTHEPSQDHLRAIVEKLGVPPGVIGYEPPRGWELVPSQWMQTTLEAQRERIDRVMERVQDVPDVTLRLEAVADQMARIESLLERLAAAQDVARRQ